MKITKHSGSSEKQIVTGMILDPVVLAQVAAKWDKENGLFSSKWCNIVAGWCIKYFTKYGKAPKTNIQGMFEDYAEHAKSSESVDLIEAFLSHLSKRAEKIKKNLNTEFILDLAKKQFNENLAKRTLQEMEVVLENEGQEKFFQKLQDINKIEIGMGSTIDVMKDMAAHEKAISDKRTPLIKFPGEADLFFGSIFERDALVAFMAPEKSGKSFWLIDIAFRAMKQGHNVAMFQCGDLSQNQIMRRLQSRICRNPILPQKLQIIDELHYHHGELKMKFKEEYFKTGVTSEMIKMKGGQILKKLGNQKQGPFKLEVHAMNTISANGIKSILLNWARLGWVPSVICIDYADILAPTFGGAGVDSRHQVNATWQALRGISQEFHACVVTATQTNAASYDKELITRSNFSEDKRKNAHVTAMLAINQDMKTEKPNGIQRINIVQLREDYFSSEEQLLVAGNFALANPMMKAIRHDSSIKKGSD